MPGITAVLHTHNDALRLGRALETLCPCDEILIFDRSSDDGTLRIAREYGAKVISEYGDSDYAEALHIAKAHWILCLDPREALTEGLSAALFEWKSTVIPDLSSSFAVFQREETFAGWIQDPAPKTRLVPAGWRNWNRYFPVNDSSAVLLDGELLRFAFP